VQPFGTYVEVLLDDDWGACINLGQSKTGTGLIVPRWRATIIKGEPEFALEPNSVLYTRVTGSGPDLACVD
jgi:hypothetical protein